MFENPIPVVALRYGPGELFRAIPRRSLLRVIVVFRRSISIWNASTDCGSSILQPARIHLQTVGTDRLIRLAHAATSSRVDMPIGLPSARFWRKAKMTIGL